MRHSICCTLFICFAIPGYSVATKSGPAWCSKYPGRSELIYLNASFRHKARDFVDALREAEATVRLISSKRLDQRQYLMHWAWQIKKDDFWLESSPPCNLKNWFYPIVPAYAGDMLDGHVEIIWNWASEPVFNVILRNCSGEEKGKSHYHIGTHGEALAAAAGMIEEYSLVHRPARFSWHVEGRAIDMIISLTGDLTIAKKDGSIETISTSPKNGSNKQLHAVGATYGVFKLVPDPPHWSEDGH